MINTSEGTTGNTNKTIILAGATGDLGKRMVKYLSQSGASVRALIRKGGTSVEPSTALPGVHYVTVDYNDHSDLVQACSGGTCVVSTLSGLEDVIIGAQSRLLAAAVAAGVPRFIPSDYSIDYTKLPDGSNRNLDLRRTFNRELDKASIQATSILNGMFMDLLTGQAPVVLPGIKRVFFWGNADQDLDFTTIENTAAFTAKAALDENTPRYLRIAGEVASPKKLQHIATTVYGVPFKLLRPGGLSAFKLLIRITKKVAPQKNEVFPAWQGMEYMHNMFTGLPKLAPLDNDRYGTLKWTGIAEVLSQAKK